MTTKPENIDTSAERVRKNPIAELMREAAAAVSSETPVMNWDDITERLHSAADEIERQEPAAWSGWGCQYPGKMPRLYGELRIAELNCDWENGDQLLHFTAAPQPAEQQPAPELYEALQKMVEMASTGMVDFSPHDEFVMSSARAALAAHRKQGGQQ